MRDLSRIVPRFDQIFPGKHFIQFLANKIGIRNFVLDNCIVIFDAELVQVPLWLAKWVQLWPGQRQWTGQRPTAVPAVPGAASLLPH